MEGTVSFRLVILVHSLFSSDESFSNYEQRNILASTMNFSVIPWYLTKAVNSAVVEIGAKQDCVA